MNSKSLPTFLTPLYPEMRVMWRRYEFKDPDVHRLLLEIEHLRRLLYRIEDSRKTIDRAWKDNVGSQLVALERLRVLLQQERERFGDLSV